MSPTNTDERAKTDLKKSLKPPAERASKMKEANNIRKKK